MTRDNAETGAIALLAIFAGAAAFAPLSAPVRIMMTSPLLLVLPGLAVTRYVLDSRGGGFQALLLSCGLSLAIAVIVGLVLNAAGVMTPLGWVGALGGLTLCACLAHVVANPGGGRLTLADDRPAFLTGGQAALFVVALCVTAGAIVLAREGAMSQREYSFTEFWMTPRRPVQQNIVTVGVHNEEKARTNYRVVMVADGAIIGRWPAVALESGETWTTDISLNRELQRSQRVEAWLYRSDRPDEVYRKVWISASAN